MNSYIELTPKKLRYLRDLMNAISLNGTIGRQDAPERILAQEIYNQLAFHPAEPPMMVDEHNLGKYL